MIVRAKPSFWELFGIFRLAILPRIAPFPYMLLHRTAYAYCFPASLGLAPTMAWGAPLFCVQVAYAFFGLDALGDELEELFGPSLNALPLLAMARTVEISLLEAMEHPEIPAPLLPVTSVLL